MLSSHDPGFGSPALLVVDMQEHFRDIAQSILPDLNKVGTYCTGRWHMPSMALHNCPHACRSSLPAGRQAFLSFSASMDIQTLRQM